MTICDLYIVSNVKTHITIINEKLDAEWSGIFQDFPTKYSGERIVKLIPILCADLKTVKYIIQIEGGVGNE